MTRRLTVALALALMVALATAAPVAGARKLFTHFTYADLETCEVWGYVSWDDYPAKDYYVEVVFYEDGVPNIVQTSAVMYGARSGTFETLKFKLSSDATTHLWTSEATLYRFGKHDKAVTTSPSQSSYSLDCTSASG